MDGGEPHAAGEGGGASPSAIANGRALTKRERLNWELSFWTPNALPLLQGRGSWALDTHWAHTAYSGHWTLGI
jgi:hypothetical protein